MQVNGRPVAAFDPEGLVFSAGVDSEMIKLYDLRSFDKVRKDTEARLGTDNFRSLYLLIYIFLLNLGSVFYFPHPRKYVGNRVD
jgi:hypothetical protein